MPDGLDKNLKILPDYIKEAGYSTHMVGKWHLGQGREYDMPWNKGFDTFLGFLEAQTDNFSHKMGNIHCLRKDSRALLRYSRVQFVTNQKEIKTGRFGNRGHTLPTFLRTRR